MITLLRSVIFGRMYWPRKPILDRTVGPGRCDAPVYTLLFVRAQIKIAKLQFVSTGDICIQRTRESATVYLTRNRVFICFDSI